MTYDNLSTLKTLAGLDHIPIVPTSNLDADLAQFAKMSGVSVDQYYLMSGKEKTFPAIDLRIDPPEVPTCNMGKLAELLKASITVDKQSPIECSNNFVLSADQKEYIYQQFNMLYGAETPSMEDPNVYLVIQEALLLAEPPDYKTVSEVFSCLYSQPKQEEKLEESEVIVPEIETAQGTQRFSTLIDVSGDVSISDSESGESKLYTGLEAAEIKSTVNSKTGSELQIYLSQFFIDDDQDSVITENTEVGIMADDWADQAIEVAEYLAELISEMEGTTLIDTFLVGQLSNFIERHGRK